MRPYSEFRLVLLLLLASGPAAAQAQWQDTPALSQHLIARLVQDEAVKLTSCTGSGAALRPTVKSENPVRLVR